MDKQGAFEMVSPELSNVPPVAKYRVGDLVRTRKDVKLKIEGIITEVNVPSKDLRLLWDSLEPHYIVKDTKNNEFLSVIERGLEKL